MDTANYSFTNANNPDSKKIKLFLQGIEFTHLFICFEAGKPLKW